MWAGSAGGFHAKTGPTGSGLKNDTGEDQAGFQDQRAIQTGAVPTMFHQVLDGARVLRLAPDGLAPSCAGHQKSTSLEPGTSLDEGVCPAPHIGTGHLSST